MKNLVIIGEKELEVKEVNGMRVVSADQIAELHKVSVKNIQMNFKRNRKRYEKGRDYFQVKEQNSEHNNLLVSKNYYSQRGYLKLVKSMNDDLSWKVQDDLIDHYFKTSKIQIDEKIFQELLLQYLDSKIKDVPNFFRKMIYYRTSGLTQAETAKLLDSYEDTILRYEKMLKKFGFEFPRQTGNRIRFPKYDFGKQLDIILELQ